MNRRKPKNRTVGVRFANNPGKMYTYRIPASNSDPFLGQALAIQQENGMTVVFVVELNPPVPKGFSYKTLTPIKLKVVPL